MVDRPVRSKPVSRVSSLLGKFVLDAESAILLRDAATAAATNPERITAAYGGVTATFYLTLLCLSAGTMMLKTPLVTQLGAQFRKGAGPRRERAYTYYYLSATLGALAAGLTVGAVGQNMGWHYGFP